MHSSLKPIRFVASLALLAAVATGMTVTLTPVQSAPVPLATSVRFTAGVSDASSQNLWYRFRVRKAGGQFEMIRDYGPVNTLDWTASKHEGTYDIEVSARDLNSGDQGDASTTIQFQPLATGSSPVVTPTGNPLIFVYSAPPCAAGSRMRVQFQTDGGSPQYTPYQSCAPGLSMNFYLAGMRADTAYSAHHIIDDGSAFSNGPDAQFTTGSVGANIYNYTVIVPRSGASSNPFLLGGPLGTYPAAHDLDGNLVWYAPVVLTFITRVGAGGEIWGANEQPDMDASQQIIRKFDLTGMTLLETNAARINEQLTALGKSTITGFHHEVRTIAGGRIALLAGVEQIMTDVQGQGDVDILGDMILVLDKDLNVVWTWDTFDNLDPHRAAILDEKCPSAGCPNFYLAGTANDWTHGNAIQETPDGNLLYSTRNQDWLIKISYDGGVGDGHVIWRFGKDGDFSIDSTDPFPWFSHQHDGNFELSDPTRLTVFDDGNTRVQDQPGNSRGQVYQVDEGNRSAVPALNADLGVYSAAVGSAQKLRDGTYHFDAGFVFLNGSMSAYSFEVDATGAIVYASRQDTILYRTFRLADMYTPM
jgi:hypothetical protein